MFSRLVARRVGSKISTTTQLGQNFSSRITSQNQKTNTPSSSSSKKPLITSLIGSRSHPSQTTTAKVSSTPKSSFSSQTTSTTTGRAHSTPYTQSGKSFSTHIPPQNPKNVPNFQNFQKLPQHSLNIIKDLSSINSTPTTLTQLSNLSKIINPHSPETSLQSSIILTTLVGAICGVLGYIATTTYTGSNKQQKITTFADIERVLAEPDPDPYSFTSDSVDDLQRRQKQTTVREYSKQDYALVMSLPEDTMPLKEKIDALRQILLRHIHQTYPIYNLIESKSAYINANIFDNIYLQRSMEAKLLHRALELPLDQEDVKNKTQKDGVRQVLNPEQLHHLRQNLTMLHDKTVHDFPTREQSEYLNDKELRQVYNELAEFSMISCVKLNYYKFVALFYNLENLVDDDNRELFARLDTTVSAEHNITGNAFTEVVDGMPQLSLTQRAIIYRNKTMEVFSSVLSETEFLIDTIPQINDAIKTNIKSEVYRFARANTESPDEQLDQNELDGFVDKEYEKTKIGYELLSALHKFLYERWLLLYFTNEERIGLMNDEEVDNLYRSLRGEYLGAKAREHTPRAFLDTYEVQKPIEYNELYNRAYLLLPTFDIEKPLAEFIVQEYQQRERMEKEIEQAGL